MFLEGLQAYYAPLITLIIFSIFVVTDRLLSQKGKLLFISEIILLFFLIVITWADACLIDENLGGMAWKLRLFTSYVNFALSPCSPLLIALIYYDRKPLKMIIFSVPLFINILFCTISIFNGCVFEITNQNEYFRGPLFVIPFAAAAFYLVSLFFSAVQQGENRPNRKVEATLIVIATLAISGAILLEVLYNLMFMMWSITEIAIILYFLLLSIQKIMYDPLTDAFTRLYYEKHIQMIEKKKKCIIAMIDINNLKKTNDTYGHESGDEVIRLAARSILDEMTHNMRLYRVGGDEFVLISMSRNIDKVEKILTKAQEKCCITSNHSTTFAYGIVVYDGEGDIENMIKKADVNMYACKQKMKV